MQGLPSEPQTLQFPEWQCAFEDAMRESDSNTLPAADSGCKDAIFSRLKAKSATSARILGAHRSERRDSFVASIAERRLSECLLGQKS